MQIDFYILAENSRRDISRMVCQLCEKALTQKMQLIIYTKSINQALLLDDLLWTFKAESFLPHCNEFTEAAIDKTFSYPIIITSEIKDKNIASSHPFLINLSSETPEFFAHFKRVAEMVGHLPEEKQAARKRYRFYLDMGYQLNKYDL